MKSIHAFVLLLVLVLSFANPSSAQEGDTSPLAYQSWVRLGGPPGGIGYDIKFDPEDPNIWYVTDGNAGLHKSNDNGNTWFSSNLGIDVRVGLAGDGLPVFCVTVDPNNPETVWVGLQGRRGVYRSDDGGATWQARTSGILEDEGLTIRGIAVQQGNSDVVYLAGEISSWAWGKEEVTGRQFDIVKGVVYKSVNGGLNWKAIWRGSNLARYILIHPDHPDILYMSTGIFDREAFNSNREEQLPGGEGVLKSMDGGVSWAQVNNGLRNLYVGSLAMHPDNPDILLAGVGSGAYSQGSGVYLTRNGAETWALVARQDDVITAVGFSYSDPILGYAASENAFSRSDPDRFEIWTDYFIAELGHSWGPKGFQPGIPIDIEVDPENPSRVFVNNYEGGNLLTNDGGQTWISASDGYSGGVISGLALDPENPAILYTNGKSGMARSLNGGIHWEGILPPDARGGMAFGTIAINPHNPNFVFSSSMEGGLFKSEDRGMHWETQIQVSNTLWDLYGQPGQFMFQGINDFEFSQSNPAIIYASFGVKRCLGNFVESCPVDSHYSLLKSSDGGITWGEIDNTPFEHISVINVEVDPSNADHLWVLVPTQGIFRSTDGAQTWEELPVDFPSMDFKTMEIMYAPDLTILLSIAEFGLYRSDDGGISWQKNSAGMEPEEFISSIVSSSSDPNIVYAASERSGLYISQDGGKNWFKNNQGLENRSLRALSLSGDGTTLYAGSEGGGVFRLSVHDQAYFNSLAPSPTETAEPTPTAESAADLPDQTPTSSPALATAQPETMIADQSAPVRSSRGWIIGISAGAILVGLIAVLVLKRKK